MADAPRSFEDLGPNEWLVDEMYEQYRTNPASVSESWQEFFADYKPKAEPKTNGAAPVEAPPAKAEPAAAKPTPEPEAKAKVEPAKPTEAPGEPIKGAAARIVSNMEASLGVPTATSYREIPAKLLEVNRRVINGYLGRTQGGKISFTHLIGYAVVRAVADEVPAMNASYVEVDGKPRIVRHEHLGLGLAVDVDKGDGTRTLLVPCIRDADTMDFREFWTAYEELIRKVRNNKLSPDDFAGTTVSLTNPGTIGTERSVPRLMQGQGLIVGVGRMDYPATYEAADPRVLADLGLSKVLTVSSTYDHRIIQGAESGLFLKRVHDLLLGEDGFYEDAFRALGVPYEAVQWRPDIHPLDRDQTMLEKQMQVNAVINAHRVRGHLIADLDPLAAKEPHMHAELDPATYGLTIWDLDREFLTGTLGGAGDRLPLGEILHILRNAYCRRIGIEYMHIQEPEEKRWIQEHVEGVDTDLSSDEHRHILERLNAAEAFEQFLGKRYVGQKRFGLDGAESAIPLVDAVLECAAEEDLDGAVLGMAHRGRLNVLTNVVGKSYDQLFAEFEGSIDPETIQGSGDVKYHLGQSGKYVSRTGAELPIELAANPSHLEAVDPVVVGMVRARQDLIDEPGTFSVLPLLLHGDAAFAGQGVVAETLQSSQISGYRVGGTIHLVINNQLGFTTPPESARSSEYPTDVAKMVASPIIHVNGDDPEACVRGARLAFAFRQRFHKDVVIDMICYRRFGHNEGDDPSYTQPLMYKKIEARRSVRKQYTENLVNRGDLTLEEAEQALNDFQSRLQDALDQTREHAQEVGEVRARPVPPPIGVLPHCTTCVDLDQLREIFRAIDTAPEGFVVHPKLAKQFDTRRQAFADGSGDVDWGLAEALSLGTLLAEGTTVRLAGQDTRRGTFSHRHSVLVDYETGAEYVPLAHLREKQGKWFVYDSLLSEYAALGFEYGYSVADKDALVAWEGQFGDFVNGATVIIDQFLVAAEDKWDQTSGLVLLLPHGYEGQGPEHSSGRIERFLTLCAEDNMQVVYPSSAGQYFHLLRRQMHREVRKPLIVFTPKSLLRAKVARSPVSDLTSGTFEEVLDDPGAGDARAVTRVVLASAKVAHEAMARRDESGAPVAVLRMEQLYPWPGERLAELIGRFPAVESLVWLQEEPRNMGAWRFAKRYLFEGYGDRLHIRAATRAESASPAAGSAAVHKQEQEQLLDDAFAGL